MKSILLCCLTISFLSFSQENVSTAITKKGSFFFYWGWNHSAYSNSDIHFTGHNYDFTLYDVEAKDRQSAFDPKIYFNPATITIPQYNLRIGYYFHEKYSISLGADHMKYVMRDYQMATISGHIENSGTGYDGVYDKQAFMIKPDFLKFEHTDGLNYLNSEVRRHDKIYTYKKFKLNLSEGLGAGFLYPRTNTTLMHNARYDQFHVAGFGLGAVAALNIEIYDRFYIQTELKVGYINMPSIRTTMYIADKAKQAFTFIQSNVVFGMNLNYKKKK
ncbi:MAG: hypothetical protein HYR91_03830 [Flavobacteriia bacterium]|nr:hypothetical protein [Flavobacteriia bacterium]